MHIAKDRVSVKMEIPRAVIRQQTDFGDSDDCSADRTEGSVGVVR